MSEIKTMTATEAKKQKVDMYYSIAPCKKCKTFLRVKIKSGKYVCPCRMKYRAVSEKRPSPI